MNFRRLAAAGLIFSAGCAGLAPRPLGLRVTVQPEVIHAGEVVGVRVEAPAGTRSARGRLDIPGSPVLPLRTSDQGRTWVFVTQIPLDAVWAPGRYQVIITAEGPDGTTLTGGVWITAP